MLLFFGHGVGFVVAVVVVFFLLLFFKIIIFLKMFWNTISKVFLAIRRAISLIKTFVLICRKNDWRH